MSDLNISVRSLLIPMVQDKLFLPNASLAEVVAYSDPVAVDDGPDWCLGMLEWRGMLVPLVSFEALHEAPQADITRKNRIAVFNSLSNNKKLPFFAMLVQGLPHLILANQSVVSTLAEDTGEEVAVKAHVLVEAEPAVIPDLDIIESMIVKDKAISKRL